MSTDLIQRALDVSRTKEQVDTVRKFVQRYAPDQPLGEVHVTGETNQEYDDEQYTEVGGRTVTLLTPRGHQEIDPSFDGEDDHEAYHRFLDHRSYLTCGIYWLGDPDQDPLKADRRRLSRLLDAV